MKVSPRRIPLAIALPICLVALAPTSCRPHREPAPPRATATQPAARGGGPATGVAPALAITPASSPAALPPPTPAAAAAIALGQAFTDVAQRVLPSVVSVHVEAQATLSEIPLPMLLPYISRGGSLPPAPLVHGTGSGVVLRSDGVILTNHHVVERARRIEVRLQDGRTLRARVLGADPATDLALIKVDAQGLAAARLGDSDQARVGEWVLAIGAPMGLEATVTHGVVSATGRGGLGANEIEDYLQTDASINPGNSGGPLVNLRGEVLGINTMIVGRHTGIGMAVSSRLAQSVSEQILRTGHVTRGFVGVSVQEFTPALAETMNAGGARGALVNDVDANGPGARGGLRVGDLITAVDGRAVATGSDVVRAITRHDAGQTARFDVLREGRPAQVVVTTSERPHGEQPVALPSATTPPPATHTLGARVEAAGPQPGAPEGSLVVKEVQPGSAADESGLDSGDVVLRVDGTPARSPADLETAMRDGRATLLVRRGEHQTFVAVRTE